MFKSKFVISAAVILGSILIQHSATAYPRASKKAEMNYLKSVLELYFGQTHPEMDRYVEQEYRNKSRDAMDVLVGGYELCDIIETANKEGISGQTVLDEGILENRGRTLEATGTTMTDEFLIGVYDNATYYLCPELY